MAGETQKDVSMWTFMSYGDPAREWFAESLGVPWPADESLPAPSQPHQSLIAEPSISAGDLDDEIVVGASVNRALHCKSLSRRE